MPSRRDRSSISPSSAAVATSCATASQRHEDQTNQNQPSERSRLTLGPGMTWSAVHSDNNAFPFRAYATFNRGWPGSVDVVASVDFHRLSNGELRFSADIGFDDGEVLLDGPSGSVMSLAVWSSSNTGLPNTCKRNRRCVSIRKPRELRS